MSAIPNSLNSYFQTEKDLFEARVNYTRKIFYAFLLLVCIILIIMPGLVSIEHSLTVRIVAGIGILGCGLAVWLGGIDYYDKKTGGRIRELATKKFDCSIITEEFLLYNFERNSFTAIAEAPQKDNQPLQIDIYEDATGKIFYCQLMTYINYSRTPLSDVKVIMEPEYSKVYSAIKSIKST